MLRHNTKPSFSHRDFNDRTRKYRKNQEIIAISTSKSKCCEISDGFGSRIKYLETLSLIFLAKKNTDKLSLGAKKVQFSKYNSDTRKHSNTIKRYNSSSENAWKKRLCVTKGSGEILA